MAKTGFFYIVKNKIFYYVDKINDSNFAHPDLWQSIVPKLFPNLSYDDREEIKMNAIYGTDRGRVTKNESGIVQILGTPGCEIHQETIKQIFDLNLLKLNIDLKIDFSSDLHYKINSSDMRLLNDYLKNVSLDNLPEEIIKISKFF